MGHTASKAESQPRQVECNRMKEELEAPLHHKITWENNLSTSKHKSTATVTPMIQTHYAIPTTSMAMFQEQNCSRKRTYSQQHPTLRKSLCETEPTVTTALEATLRSYEHRNSIHSWTIAPSPSTSAVSATTSFSLEQRQRAVDQRLAFPAAAREPEKSQSVPISTSPSLSLDQEATSLTEKTIKDIEDSKLPKKKRKLIEPFTSGASQENVVAENATLVATSSRAKIMPPSYRTKGPPTPPKISPEELDVFYGYQRDVCFKREELEKSERRLAAYQEFLMSKIESAINNQVANH